MLLEEWGEFSQKQVPIEGSNAGQVFKKKESMIIDKVEEDTSHFSGVDKDTKKVTESMVCVPLIVENDCIGVMQLLNKTTGNYSNRDRILLENFANQSAIAIRNAKHFESLVAHMGLYTTRENKNTIEQIIDEINSKAKEVFATIMFADLRGSTQLWQTFLKNPDKAQNILMEFLTMVSDEIINHDGIVNKFLGDGVLAFFRNENHAKQAIYAAISMVNIFPELRSQWDEQSKSPLDYLDIGIGIATDRVIIGSLGAEKVRDFTVFGDAVNLASMFEQQARNGKRILVDFDTYTSVKDIVHEVEGPDIVYLKKADQAVGLPYKRFHIKTLNYSKGTKVFISHNSKDKPFVRKLDDALRARGIDIWYDERDLIPGQPWQDQLEEIIRDAKAALILIGKDGVGPWEKPEIQGCLNEFVGRKMPVIPLILPDVKEKPELPMFLNQFMWIDLREGLTKANLDRLEQGISSCKKNNQ
jgi:class 3 adenylate cyclase